MYLCLFSGGVSQQLPQGLGTDSAAERNNHAQFVDKRSYYKQDYPIILPLKKITKKF